MIKLAREDIALLVKVADLNEDQFEKLAADLGMTKEALKGKILGAVLKLFGRGKGALPSASQAQAGLQSMRLAPKTAPGLLKQRGAIQAPASWLRGGGHSPSAIPILPRGGRGAGALQKGEASFDKIIKSYVDKPVAAAASGGAPWTLGRKLKWGAGLGGAGLLGYSAMGGGGGQQAPQQYYGQQAAYGY